MTDWLAIACGDPALAEELSETEWRVLRGSPWYAGHARARVEARLEVREAGWLFALPDAPPRPRFDLFTGAAVFRWLASSRVLVHRRAVIGVGWPGRGRLWVEGILTPDPPDTPSREV